MTVAFLTLRIMVLVISFFLVTPSFAGTKIDLSPYLGNLRMPGDFKVYSFSDGGQRRATTLAVEPWKKGWKQVVEAVITGTGDKDGTARFEDYVIPRKKLLSGSEFFDDGITFFVRKPAKDLKLQATPGKVQKTKKKARLIYNGADIGTAERLGVWVVDGVETVATPSGTYPNALRAQSFSGLRLDDGFDELVYLWSRTLWYAEEVGLVRAEVDLEFYVNGSLDTVDSWTEELISGSLGGVPFP